MATNNKRINQFGTDINLTGEELILIMSSGVTLNMALTSVKDFVLSGESITGSTGVIEILYNDLLELHNTSGLTIGTHYLITDFKTCYDQPDFNYYGNGIYGDNYRQGPVEPLLVFADSTFGLAPDVYSPMYPNDKIKYDITWTATEATQGVAMGRIIERIDDKNNRTDYDHRNILFKRYNSYYLDTRLTGSIISVNGNTVVGFNTYFQEQLTVNDIIYIPTPESNRKSFYKVINIIDNNNLEIEGHIYYNYNSNNEYGVDIWKCVQETESIPGTLYYFNDFGSNNYTIEDGGSDMYDGGNILSTDLSGNIPYTHTKMTMNPYNEASLNDFIMDGSVQVGNGYFGAESNYFTNLYPDLFVMVADNISVDYLQIGGYLGADGSGEADVYDYSTTYNNTDYQIFVKRVGDGGFDPSVNHIIIAKTSSTGLTHTVSYNTDDDTDMVSGFTANSVTQIHYLLTALSKGVRLTNQQVNNVVEAYLTAIDNNSDINLILSSLNTNYQTITNVLPQKSSIVNSLDFSQSNIIGDTGYTEVKTFEYSNAQNTYIGDYANYYYLYEYPFMLSNNTFGSHFNIATVFNNKFADNFYNNSFGNDVIQNNIGSESRNNLFYNGFYNNNLGNNFTFNTSYRNNFEDNNIANNFNYNLLTDYFWRNSITNDFQNNLIFNYFNNNNIENEFNYNIIKNNFRRNIIDGEFNYNIIYSGFYDNSIGQEFNNNRIYSIFNENKIGINFNNNAISDKNNINEGNFRDNVIGNYFQNNIISYNFYSNNIKSNFENNTVRDYFRLNNIETNLIGYDLTGGSHLYNYYTCNVIMNANSDYRLTYFDNSNVLTVVDVNA